MIDTARILFTASSGVSDLRNQQRKNHAPGEALDLKDAALETNRRRIPWSATVGSDANL
jgi:hypothetical protein